jgi:hypothetical protein
MCRRCQHLISYTVSLLLVPITGLIHAELPLHDMLQHFFLRILALFAIATVASAAGAFALE